MRRCCPPAVRSPFVPSSKNCCVADPPIPDKSAATAIPVLAGFEPGATETVSSVELPACTVAGFASPVPTGFVGALLSPRIEMSSIASACPLVVVVPLDTE